MYKNAFLDNLIFWAYNDLRYCTEWTPQLLFSRSFTSDEPHSQFGKHAAEIEQVTCDRALR